MCFSPEVSFTASAVISAIGIMTLCKVTDRRQILFALIPLIFASQQLIEGLLWLVLLKHELPISQYFLIETYSIYAYIIWPVIIPVSILLIEPDAERRKFIRLISFIGIAAAFYSAMVVKNSGISVSIVNYCIKYTNTVPQSEYNILVYIIVTCLPFFISSQSIIRWIGLLNVITFLIAYYVYNVVYISVWCFFAASVSGFIYFYFEKLQRNKQTFRSVIKKTLRN